jgi:hypothetical protein
LTVVTILPQSLYHYYNFVQQQDKPTPCVLYVLVYLHSNAWLYVTELCFILETQSPIMSARAQFPNFSVKGALLADMDLTDSLFVSCSLGAFHPVPPEVVEAILGSLDLRTLCAARLVCKLFRASASQFLHSLKLSPKGLRLHRITNFSNFPKLRRVTMLDVSEADFPLLACPAVGDAVTHMTLVLGRVSASLEMGGASMPPLPNLVSLTVLYNNVNNPFKIPLTVKELFLDNYVAYPNAVNLIALTRLTCLRVNLYLDRQNPFEGLTALATLQQLDIGGPKSLIPFLGKLTLLTHLHFRITAGGPDLDPSLTFIPLTCLGKLVHLGIKSHDTSMSVQHVSEVSRTAEALTLLKSLALGLVHGPAGSLLDAHAVRALSRLTGLGLSGSSVDASSLSWFYLEGLQSLTLQRAAGLERGLVATLGRATALTKLSLSYGERGAVFGRTAGVRLAISCMPQLRELSLSMENRAPHDPWSFEAIRLLTSLTSLSWEGGQVTNADLEVCLGLRNLHVLKIMPGRSGGYPPRRVDPDTCVALAKLPELARFEMRGAFGIDRGPIIALIESDRRSKGWPPLELYFFSF